MDNEKKEICTISIMFPVESDDKAIEYKKRIAELLKDKPEAQIQFSIMSGAHRAPLR